MFHEYTLDELTAPPFAEEKHWPEPADADEKPDDEEMDTLDHAASYYADLL